MPAFDFASDFSYGLVTASLERIGTISGGTFVQSNEGRMLDVTTQNKSLDWQTSRKTMTFVFGSERSAFGPVTLETETTVARSWRLLAGTPYRDDILTLVSPMTQARYSIGATQSLSYNLTDGTGRRQEIDRYAVGGRFTFPSDFPTSGVVTYTVNATSTSATRDGGGGFLIKPRAGTTSVTTDIQIDYAASAFRIPIVLEQSTVGDSGAKVALTATLVGTLDKATGRIEGTIESADSTYRGGFAGALFGPKAREIGIVFILHDPSRPSVVGRLSGVAP